MRVPRDSHSGTRLLSFVVVFLSLCAGTFSQANMEWGDWRELSGVKKVFIDVGVDNDLRRTIMGEITKNIPALTLVSLPDEAEIHIVGWTWTVKEGAYPARVRVGRVVKILGPRRRRVLLEYTEPWPLRSRNPGLEFVKQFVKAYVKAN
jgi:hypothetical protein